jgi:hydrogenase 3 maturation protease
MESFSPVVRRRLADRMRRNPVVLAIGSELRGDDGFGPILAQRLLEGSDAVIDAGSVPENYLGVVAGKNPGFVLAVDSVDLNAPAGSLCLLELTEVDSLEPSTHRFPLGLILRELIRRTGAEVSLLAVQPGCLALGTGLTPPVETALKEVIGFLRPLLSRAR